MRGCRPAAGPRGPGCPIMSPMAKKKKNNVGNSAKRRNNAPRKAPRKGPRRGGSAAHGASRSGGALTAEQRNYLLSRERHARDIHLSPNTLRNETVLATHIRMASPADARNVQTQYLAQQERFMRYEPREARPHIRDTYPPGALAAAGAPGDFPCALYRGIVTQVRYAEPWGPGSPVEAVCIMGPRIFDPAWTEDSPYDDPFYCMVGTHLWLRVARAVPGAADLDVHIGDTLLFAGEAEEYESEGAGGEPVARRGVARWTPVAAELVYMIGDRVCELPAREWEFARVFSQRGGAVEPALKGELDPDIAAMKADPVYSAEYRETWNPKFDKLR